MSAKRCSHTLICSTFSPNAAGAKFSFLHTGDRELVRLTTSQSSEQTETAEHSGFVLILSDLPCGRLGLEQTGELQLALDGAPAGDMQSLAMCILSHQELSPYGERQGVDVHTPRSVLFSRNSRAHAVLDPRKTQSAAALHYGRPALSLGDTAPLQAVLLASL